VSGGVNWPLGRRTVELECEHGWVVFVQLVDGPAVRADDDQRNERLSHGGDVDDVDAGRAERVERASRHVAQRVADRQHQQVLVVGQVVEVRGQFVGLLAAVPRVEVLQLLNATRRLHTHAHTPYDAGARVAAPFL